ncbi:MAG: DUF3159 domain-containing protein, partial [Nocardia sp.]|nr:DUF3159 domain-containing protein [Nocardia sp.]
MTEQRTDRTESEAAVPVAEPAAETPAAARKPNLLDQMGGPMGFVYSTLPVVVFVAANAVLPLAPTIGISLAVGVALTVFRLVRGERFSSVVGGLLGIGVAVGIVAWTGSAKDFFVLGI